VTAEVKAVLRAIAIVIGIAALVAAFLFLRSCASAPAVTAAATAKIQQESAETLTLAARNATAVPGSTLDGVATIDRQTETNYDAITHDTVIIALFQPSACGPYIAINRAARPCSKPVPEPLARETPGADMPVMDADLKGWQIVAGARDRSAG
jgi:uncharacterized membrane protein